MATTTAPVDPDAFEILLAHMEEHDAPEGVRVATMFARHLQANDDMQVDLLERTISAMYDTFAGLRNDLAAARAEIRDLRQRVCERDVMKAFVEAYGLAEMTPAPDDRQRF